MNKVALTVTAIIASSMLSNNAIAEIYIGGKVGYTTLDDTCKLNAPCDSENFSAGLHIGYNFNKYFSIEQSTDYLGDFSFHYEKPGLNTIDGSLWAISLAPKVSFTLTDNLTIFTKLGGAYMLADDERDLVFTAGVGTEYTLSNKWSVRAEYQTYQDMTDTIVRQLDADQFSVGFTYRFAEPEIVVSPPVEETIRPTTRIIEHVHPATIERIYFPSDSASYDVQSDLSTSLNVLKTYPQATLEVSGFTDSTGSAKHNQILSEKRANTIAQSFLHAGIDTKRITVIGKGETEPAADNATAEGRNENRRVEVVIPAFKFEATQ